MIASIVIFSCLIVSIVLLDTAYEDNLSLVIFFISFVKFQFPIYYNFKIALFVRFSASE